MAQAHVERNNDGNDDHANTDQQLSSNAEFAKYGITAADAKKMVSLANAGKDKLVELICKKYPMLKDQQGELNVNYAYVQAELIEIVKQESKSNNAQGRNGQDVGLTMVPKQQKRKIKIMDTKGIGHDFAFAVSVDANSTTITKSVQELHPSLRTLHFYRKKTRLHIDLNWNDNVFDGDIVTGRNPLHTNKVGNQVPLSTKKKETCLVKTRKITVNPVTAPFVVGRYVDCVCGALIALFIIMIVLATFRHNWFFFAILNFGGVIFTVIKRCYSDKGKSDKKQNYNKWEVFALTCNAEIDGVSSAKSIHLLSVEFFIGKGICFLPLFGLPLAAMIGGIAYKLPFYVDLIAGLIAYVLYLSLYHSQCVQCRDYCQCKKMLTPTSETIFALEINKQKSIEVNADTDS